MRLYDAIRSAAFDRKPKRIWRSHRGVHMYDMENGGIAWEVDVYNAEDGAKGIKLFHWGTLMAECEYRNNEWELIYSSVGWGSVSDQTGMNELFSALSMPYRMDRDKRGGGPKITKRENSGS